MAANQRKKTYSLWLIPPKVSKVLSFFETILAKRGPFGTVKSLAMQSQKF